MCDLLGTVGNDVGVTIEYSTAIESRPILHRYRKCDPVACLTMHS